MTLHVLAQNVNWLVKEEGNTTALSVHPTQSEAVEAGRKRAKVKNAELIIHSRDGGIVDASGFADHFVNHRSKAEEN